MSVQKTRCSWATNDLLIAYHDTEYGNGGKSDNDIFERMCLESFSAGLSWYIALSKRDALRDAFCGFDIGSCANLTDDDLEDILSRPDIIRNARKVYAVRDNAIACLRVLDTHPSLYAFVCDYPDARSLHAAFRDRGSKQFGPVSAEELLRSLAMIPAHETGCDWCRPDVEGAKS